jgi:putative salt-induced outer membrane protein
VATSAYADSFWNQVETTTETFAAAEQAQKNPSGFSASVSLGYLGHTGNTDSRSLNFKGVVGYADGPWRHALTLRAVGASNSGDTTDEEYEVGEQSNYFFTPQDYVFGALDWDKDRFSGYNQRTTEVAGYGRRLLNSKTMTLDAQIGLGARQSNLSDGTHQNSAVAQAGIDYVWNITDNSSFTQNLSAQTGADNTLLESITALKATIMDPLALSLSYTVEHNTSVPADRVKTDTTTVISLEYSF